MVLRHLLTQKTLAKIFFFVDVAEFDAKIEKLWCSLGVWDIVIQLMGLYLFVLPTQRISRRASITGYQGENKSLELAQNVLVWTLIIIWTGAAQIVYGRIVE